MQIYKNNLDSKSLFIEFLDFLRHKAESGSLTLREIEGLSSLFRKGVSLSGTAEDIASYYHRTPQDVRNVIHRKMLAKPQRRVYYSFDEFQEIAPVKWKTGKMTGEK